MSEYLNYYELPIRTDDDDMYADFHIYELENGSIAQGVLEARGHGDEIMSLVISSLSQEAQDLGKPVVHIFTATNPAAIALVERTPGYEHSGYDQNGNPIYHRTFHP